MSRISETQRAKQLYLKVQKADKTKRDYPWSPLKPGLRRYGLRRRWVWVAYGNRAYYLKAMSLDHMKNTIKALKNRHPDELRKPLEIHYLKKLLKHVRARK
jgi:hypothetical protein